MWKLTKSASKKLRCSKRSFLALSLKPYMSSAQLGVCGFSCQCGEIGQCRSG
ncbi:hypothetical protein CFELI_14080 [Corynebacterium felinum]|uniref:Uncharacterized protein n=1 Tax=Corynebacterium felinum TaxID=131318 RepID=A0ABU2B6I0_9CORY|nr:hypothetical protein [Corynebacterium felinum]WJY96387.1 hypothetical protein CFELI_14080 [Corynebacterium felinum]